MFELRWTGVRLITFFLEGYHTETSTEYLAEYEEDGEWDENHEIFVTAERISQTPVDTKRSLSQIHYWTFENAQCFTGF